MLKHLLLQIGAALGGLWIAIHYIPGVSFPGSIAILLLASVAFGLLNTFVKPILNVLTFPLKVLTLGLFAVVLNLAVVELLDILFDELVIQGLIPLVLTTLILWILSMVADRIGHIIKKPKPTA